VEEPQLDALRQTLAHGIQSIWSHFEALTVRAIGWWQSLDPQHKKLLKGLGVILILLLVVLAVWKIPQRQLAPLKAKIQSLSEKWSVW
jgi:type II secretory pathway component PulM